MKQIKCEICGNNDLIKQDGLFVCQYCGAKYTVDEAKKLMIDGPVDVSGSSVKIDDSDRLGNYYQMAESAFTAKNYKETENYCNRILESTPQDYKTWLLKGRAAIMQADVKNFRIDEMIACFDKAKSLNPKLVTEIASYLYHGVVHVWDNIIVRMFESIARPPKSLWLDFTASGDRIIQYIEESISMSNDEICEKYNSMIKIADQIILSSGCDYDPTTQEITYYQPDQKAIFDYKNKILSWKNEITSRDPNFEIVEVKSMHKTKVIPLILFTLAITAFMLYAILSFM